MSESLLPYPLHRPLGIFDSGVGGLTVLKALRRKLPHRDFVYLGDTARVPYGRKPAAMVAEFAYGITEFLRGMGVEGVVIACNTASALALDAIKEAVTVPVLGVIEPGAAAAAQNSKTKDVLVIATEATVASHAYAAACRAQGLRGVEKACPLLVPLVEEGWTQHPVTAEVVRIYLSELLAEAAAARQNPDTLVLGCTHYPLLRAIMEHEILDLAGPNVVRIIDSAEATAEEASQLVQSLEPNGVRETIKTPDLPQIRCFATDSVEKFARLGSRFLGLPVGKVQLVDLGG